MYRPSILNAKSLEELQAILQRELDQVARVFAEGYALDMIPQAVEPKRFKEGSVVWFEPGVAVTGIASTQAGPHIFRAGAWRRLAEV